jgi:hypothetical protein
MNKKELEAIRKKFNETLKKEKEKPISKKFFLKWIECIKASKNYDSWIDALERYIWNDPYYIKYSTSYCRFLELEYKNRNKIEKYL